MDEWKEVMPEIVNQIKDEQTRKTFQDLIPKIYKKFEEEGGIYPPNYITKMVK